ncbi:MAG: SMC-Scp complex subunit ScpB [Rhodobacteraceae bacterium]|nr:SMC-Scp complex subunit ScpB [Paracoccaceae bacterium]
MDMETDFLEALQGDRSEEVTEVGETDFSGMRMAEALLFASADPLSEEELASRLPEGCNIAWILEELSATYEKRGVNLVRVAGKWSFRTADDLGFLMHRSSDEPRKLSRAALETLAIIAYHQPVTRAEIEEIRGVSTSKGTLDVLLETNWIRMRGRRRTPGRPVTYGTTEAFLVHFGLDTVKDLPGLAELKGAGLLDSAIPASFFVPTPDDNEDLTEEEDPLEEDGLFDADASEDEFQQ